MNEPVSDHSRRALTSAVFLARVWACVSLLLGGIASAPLSIALMTGHTRFATGHILYFAAVTFVFVVPAVLYLIIATYVQQRREWAVIAGIVIASLHGLCAIVGLIGLLILTHVTGLGFIIAPSLGALLFIAATTHLIYMLSRAFGALHVAGDAGGRRGFEPLQDEDPQSHQRDTTKFPR